MFGFNTKDLTTGVLELSINQIVNEDWFVCSDKQIAIRVWKEAIDVIVEVLNDQMENIQIEIAKLHELKEGKSNG